MLAWCYAGTDMVDWRNMTFLWQSAVSSCYQHISSCNYCTASLGLGEEEISFIDWAVCLGRTSERDR